MDPQTALQEAIREEWGNVRYNNILTKSKKKPAGTQWLISTVQLRSFVQLLDVKTLGALPTSEDEIIKVAKAYMGRLNGELMELFSATKALSENINKYFTFDKRPRAIGSAERAIQNSVQIQNTLTAQIAEPDEEPEESP